MVYDCFTHMIFTYDSHIDNMINPSSIFEKSIHHIDAPSQLHQIHAQQEKQMTKYNDVQIRQKRYNIWKIRHRVTLVI